MSGLIGYPRSYGTALPPSIATALRELGFISESDVGLYEKHYVAIEGPNYLRPNSYDLNHQPGAIDRSSVAIQQPAQIIHPPPSDIDANTFLNTLTASGELEHALSTFQGTVNVIQLKTGTTLYRVVGAVVPNSENDWKKMQADPRRVVNYPAGSFWTYEDLTQLNSEAEWRGSFAVKTEWNGDHGYVVYVLDRPQYVLFGLTGMQNSADPNKVFPGGGSQIYVPVGTLDPTKGGTLSNKSVIQPFSWSNGQ